jgi:tripartite-type tricarboxylate transporter receptor subunit TctC
MKITHLMKRLAAVSAVAACALAAPLAAAQDFPSKPIRIIVPFSAGGGVDTLARMVGQRLAEQVGQPVLVENKPGAGGNIATAFVATQPADGYTILIGANGLAANPSLYANLPFDMARDFAPVAYIGGSPMIMVAAPTFPPRNLQELVAAAREQPGKLTYATGGSGTSGHLASEMLKSAARVDLSHVAYKGGTQAFVDLQAGRVNVMFIDPPLAMPQIKAGRLKALVVGTPNRFHLLPDVPTVAESGVPGFDASVWWGFVAPAKTPPAVLAKLNAEINKAIAHASLKDRLNDMGVVPQAMSPEQFGRFLAAETDKWSGVIKRANIQAE